MGVRGARGGPGGRRSKAESGAFGRASHLRGRRWCPQRLLTDPQPERSLESLLLPGPNYNKSHGLLLGDYVAGGDVFIWGEKRGANHCWFQERVTCRPAREQRTSLGLASWPVAHSACPRWPVSLSGAPQKPRQRYTPQGTENGQQSRRFYTDAHGSAVQSPDVGTAGSPTRT